MKCSSCGGEIGLTDERCPHCGRILTETAGHQAALRSYSERNEIAKRGLARVIAGNTPLIISAVLMAILLVANVVAFYVAGNAYHFRSDAMRRESAARYNEYSREIEKYLEAGDYTGFAAFKEYHNIAEWEPPYDDLRLLWDMAESYTYLVSNIESAVMFGPDAEWYRPEWDISDCRSRIRDFYHEYEYRHDEIEADQYAEYIHDMKEKADIILRVYLGLDDAEREAYLASSDIEQEAYLEEVLINE